MSSDNSSPVIRKAGSADISEIVRITNRAYVVERPLIRGDRTDAEDIGRRMEEGRFLVLPSGGGEGVLAGSVFVKAVDGRGYLGMLAVDPDLQGRGISRALVDAVERECLDSGCSFLDLTVLSLRTELFPLYRHFGFAPSDVLPYPHPELLIKPLHMVQMTKPLKPDEAL